MMNYFSDPGRITELPESTPPKSVDPRAMSLAELAAWAMEDPPAIPLHHFPLHSDAGRQGFLREFYNVGAGALFAAFSHVWASLADPAAARCTAMGLAAGTGGTGKAALVAVLTRFLNAALAGITPIPAGEGFANLDEWHRAAMQTFDADERHLRELLKTYSAILNGDPAPKTAANPTSQLLAGPWPAQSAE